MAVPAQAQDQAPPVGGVGPPRDQAAGGQPFDHALHGGGVHGGHAAKVVLRHPAQVTQPDQGGELQRRQLLRLPRQHTLQLCRKQWPLQST